MTTQNDAQYNLSIPDLVYYGFLSNPSKKFGPNHFPIYCNVINTFVFRILLIPNCSLVHWPCDFDQDTYFATPILAFAASWEISVSQTNLIIIFLFLFDANTEEEKLQKDILHTVKGFNFAAFKFSRKRWQDILRGGNFHDTTPISFIKPYGFYFREGVIFAKKTKAWNTRKLPPRENFHVYSNQSVFVQCRKHTGAWGN